MYVTYCLAIDKLYLPDEIPDNFKHFFQWSKQVPSKSVVLKDFITYLAKAPKQQLIDNSRFILKKYFNI